jgi:hypothetical protein
MIEPAPALFFKTVPVEGMATAKKVKAFAPDQRTPAFKK